MQRIKNLKRVTTCVIVLSLLMALGVAFLRGTSQETNGDHQMHSNSNTKEIEPHDKVHKPESLK
jgi:hypothetical protein